MIMAGALWLMPTPTWATTATEVMPLERMWLVIILIVLLQTLVIIGLQHNRLVNKRSQHALKEAQKALEERIHERTEVLNQTNNQLYDEIAQHEATEILLRETQDYLHSIINAMPSVLIGVTHQGYITHWNTAAEQETGISADDALGRHISEAYPKLPVSPDTISSVIEAGVPYINESVQQNHKGEVRYTDLSIFPLIAVQAIGAVIRMDDVTLRVRMEHMMIQNEKMMSLGELAAGMAHEINNPLSAILHGVQNIHRRTAPDFPANQKVASEMRIDLAQVHAYLRARDIYKILDDWGGDRVLGTLALPRLRGDRRPLAAGREAGVGSCWPPSTATNSQNSPWLRRCLSSTPNSWRRLSLT
jgi:PAS domain S-box-containing protein